MCTSLVVVASFLQMWHFGDSVCMVVCLGAKVSSINGKQYGVFFSLARFLDCTLFSKWFIAL